MAFLLVILVSDVFLARIYDLIPKQYSYSWKIIVFVTFVSISIPAQLVILVYMHRKNLAIRTKYIKFHIVAIHQIARISQLVISAILIALTIQTVFMQSYHSMFVIVMVSLSYTLAVFVISVLAQRFFSWYRSSRNPVIVLYGIASTCIATNLAFTLAFVTDVLASKPVEVMYHPAGSLVTILPDSITAALNTGFFSSSIISFALLWGATAVLLYQNSGKFGKLKYWLIITSPLILFFSQFITLLIPLLDPLFRTDPVATAFWATMIFTLSKPAGGVLFGIAFLVITRSFKSNSLRNYILLSVSGFILLYVSDQASVLLVTPFPPFGVTSVSFVGLASYLVFLGIYSSAIILSEDTQLRRLVRREAQSHPGLLDSMGTAHLTETLQRRVTGIVKKNSEKLAQATGLEDTSSEEERKGYIEDVMEEVRRMKKKARSKDFDEGHEG